MSIEKPDWQHETESMKVCKVEIPAYGLKAQGVFYGEDESGELAISLHDCDELGTFQGMLVGEVKLVDGRRVMFVKDAGEALGDPSWEKMNSLLVENDLIYEFSGELVHLAAWMSTELGVERVVWEDKMEIGVRDSGFLESVEKLLGPGEEVRAWSEREMSGTERAFYDTGRADLGGGIAVEMGFPDELAPSVFKLKLVVKDELVGYLQGDVYTAGAVTKLIVEVFEDQTRLSAKENSYKVFEVAEEFLRGVADEAEDDWLADNLQMRMVFLGLRYLGYWYGDMELVVGKNGKKWDAEKVEQITKKWLGF